MKTTANLFVESEVRTRGRQYLSEMQNASLPKWMKLQPDLWYKATATESVVGIEDKDRVWIKVNTEFPHSKLSYWLYDPVRKLAAHIGDAVIHEYVRLLVQGGKPVSATPQEQKVLDKYWTPVIQDKVERQRKIVKKYNRLQEKRK